MANIDSFKEEINQGYTFKGNSFVLGGAMLDKQSVANTPIKVPLKSLNRHGLIAGATGTGKTKSVQLFSEKLSENGISVLMMDIKGDFSGIAAEGTSNPKIEERKTAIGIDWKATKYPTEVFSISQQDGVRLRATVAEFGPILISKILDLNDTQQGVIATLFKYCDDAHLPLLDLEDFKKVLQFASTEGKEELEKEYGAVSPATFGTILRKVVELEQQGANIFFGETSFDVNDLLRKDSNGYGYINVIRLTDIQDKPKLFSTFMLSLLAEIYEKFPEKGDQEKPDLVIFIDEAHLVFQEASKALNEQIETIVKLIRSKGVGVFFCTQNPNDIPNDVLGQLGMKIQHALRAFTAKDRKAIKLVAENYPYTENYEVENIITEMGIGEALVTVLNEKGIPTPLVHTLMAPPQSRMDVLSDSELNTLIKNSNLYNKYNQVIDRESAYEMLSKKMLDAEKDEAKKEVVKERKTTSKKAEQSTIGKVLNSTTGRQVLRTATSTLTRGLLGILKNAMK
ncbi:MAG: helicase HerA-like domain-containing protein [Chitinophagales bacterium]